MWCQGHSQLKSLYVHHVVTDWEDQKLQCHGLQYTSINESQSTGSVFGSVGHRQHDFFSPLFCLPFSKKSSSIFNSKGTS